MCIPLTNALVDVGAAWTFVIDMVARKAVVVAVKVFHIVPTGLVSGFTRNYYY
jgi:hypothetical protein